jgi:hypothetical protein
MENPGESPADARLGTSAEKNEEREAFYYNLGRKLKREIKSKVHSALRGRET